MSENLKYQSSGQSRDVSDDNGNKDINYYGSFSSEYLSLIKLLIS